MQQQYFELFWTQTNLSFNGRKPENISLMRQKNTCMPKDGEDQHGLQKTNLKN